MPVHKNMPRPVYLQWGSHESSKVMNHGVVSDPFTSAIEFIGMLNHVGTHVDAFYHLKQDGRTIDEMPLDMFMGKAVCFDLTHIPDLGDIDVKDMEQAEAKTGVNVNGHIVLLNTGLHRRHYGPATAGSMAIPGPNCYRCPIKHCRDKCDMTCLDVGFGLYDSQSVGAPAAVLVEPIQSSAGIIVPPVGYFKRLKELCDERGLLLIVDEAQTGLGRLGSNFAFEQLDVVPDILTLSKTLGNGLPMAATITSDKIEKECFEKQFLFYTSHLSDPMPAAVGLAVLRVLREGKLAERSKEMGEYLMGALRSLQQRHECIGDVRGRGLLIGLEIVKDRESRQADRPLAHKLQRLCLEMGLVVHAVRADSQSSIRLAPPLTVSKEELDKGIGIIDKAFRRALDS